MGLISIASNASAWRGYEYYKDNKVKDYTKISEYEYEYEGIVEGGNKKTYQVLMNHKHPRKSKCNCPHAKDRSVICKHIVAVFFTIFPKEVKAYMDEVEESERIEEEREEERFKDIVSYVNGLTKEQLKQELIQELLKNNRYF